MNSIRRRPVRKAAPKIPREPDRDTKYDMMSEAMDSIKSAISSLEDKSGYFENVIDILKDALNEMEPEYQRIDFELQKEYDDEIAGLTRDYYRMVAPARWC